MQANSDLPNRDHSSVDEIVAHIRAEVARRKVELGQIPATRSPVPITVRLRQDIDGLDQQLPHPQEIEEKSTYDLAEFCRFHDEEFIINAYRGILRREADDKGLADFLEAYRDGILSKSEILGRLRYSSEGRRLGIRVRGLLPRFALLSTYHIPFFGYLIAIFSSIARLPVIVKDSKKFEAFSLANERQQAKSVRALANQVSEQFEDALASKADTIFELRTSIDGIRRSLSAKAEVESLFKLTGALADISRSLASKAEIDSISELRIALENTHRSLAKAEIDIISELRTAVDRVERSLATKAESDTVSELRTAIDGLERSLATKAESGTVSELRTAIDGLERFLATKAESGTVSELRTAIDGLERSLATKAQNNAVSELRVMLESVSHSLGAKVENSAISELRLGLDSNTRAIATKAEVGEIAALRTGLESIGEKLANKVELRDMLEILEQFASYRRALTDQERRLGLLFEELRKRLPAPITTTQIERALAEEDHLMDALYASFEDQFRGTREDIKRRVVVYLPIVKETGAGTEATPILDLGCGRGEWLELLRDEHLAARGLDLNRWMVSKCRDIGLDVLEADAIDHLRSLVSDSLGAITAMHVVEHLPFARLVPLLDEVLRVLKPGGVAIFETPNPENLIVGACNFYFDPTHIRPIPPPTIQFLAESRGFVKGRIERLNASVLTNPFRGIEEGGSSAEVRLIRNLVEQMYFGPPDYALIAYKA